MKLIVFGATGGTGQHLVKQALAQGHMVTAFVRNPAKFGVSHPGLRIVQGDVLDAASVEQAVSGHDAVLAALGAPARDTNKVRSEGTRNIISAMEKTGVRRLVCQTSLGYGDSIQVLVQDAVLLQAHYRSVLPAARVRGSRSCRRTSSSGAFWIGSSSALGI